MKYSIWFLMILMGIVFTSCGEDAIPEDEQILAYLADKGITNATKANTGYYYVIDVQGAEPFAIRSSTVTVSYTGYLLNDDVFDSSNGNPVTFPLSNLIEGWQQFIPLLGTGGEGRVFLPSKLAYGTRGSGPIDADTPIAFDIKLFAVQ